MSTFSSTLDLLPWAPRMLTLALGVSIFPLSCAKAPEGPLPTPGSNPTPAPVPTPSPGTNVEPAPEDPQAPPTPEDPPVPDPPAPELVFVDTPAPTGPLVAFPSDASSADDGNDAPLVYTPYANEGQDNAVHTVPDFSTAGYRGGGVAIPTWPATITLVPDDDDEDDLPRIQAALDAVGDRAPSSSGHRGVVVLEAGVFEVGGTLFIRNGGVVLRGAGQGQDGTVLLATKRARHTLIEMGAKNAQGDKAGRSIDLRSRRTIAPGVVPVGSRSFELEDPSAYAVGDRILVTRTPNDLWIEAIGMAPWGWSAPGYRIAHERRITAIDGPRVTVDIPLVDPIDSFFGGGIVIKISDINRIVESGVERLRLRATYDTSNPTDEEHAWTGVYVTRAENSWVRQVTAEHFGYATVEFGDGASFNSAEEVAYVNPVSQITGARRYPFYVSGGVGNLFQRCYADQGRHNFVTGSRVTGPHVWLDCLAENAKSDDGPHHRWATGILFDNIKTREMAIQNRTDWGSGHGWAGAQNMLWRNDTQIFICDSPKTAQNWAVATTGQQREGDKDPGAPSCIVQDGTGANLPRSLYLQQLADRLGLDAVANVTTEAQRRGTIFDDLARWAGQGEL